MSFVVTPRFFAADVNAARVECALKLESTPTPELIDMFLIHLEIVADFTGLCGLLYEINSGFATLPVGRWSIVLLS